jgi:hypothetical protein
MSLASNYAALLSSGTEPDAVLAYMKQKGHLSLLPHIARLLEREAGVAGDTVLVAKEGDVRTAQEKFPSARVQQDPRVVGGYLAKVGGKIIDATYRRALVNIYKQVTK